MLLSSAKFAPGKIEVAERVGLDLILPVACMLPAGGLGGGQLEGRLGVLVGAGGGGVLA